MSTSAISSSTPIYQPNTQAAQPQAPQGMKAHHGGHHHHSVSGQGAPQNAAQASGSIATAPSAVNTLDITA